MNKDICTQYALGRMTYIVADTVSFFSKKLIAKELSEAWRIQATKDIKQAIDSNQYGMQQDKEMWKILLERLKD